MKHLFGLASECRCYINRRYKTFDSTLHCALENGAYLYVNERRKVRHYRARSIEERRKKKNAKLRFLLLPAVRTLYSDVIIIYTHSIVNQS